MLTQHLTSKCEWTAPEAMPMPLGRYYGATGVQYEVLGHNSDDDTVNVMRCDNGNIKRIPRPLAKSMLEPVRIKPSEAGSDAILVVLTVAMGIVIGLIWWSW